MTATTQRIANMLEMLPEKEQEFACAVMQKLILAWDSDFTKLTSQEAAELKLGKKQIANGEYYSHDEIDWDNLDNMDLD